MATYKVPQDVEAEDKLLGPFSLKQVIFILLFFASAWMAYVLYSIALPLASVMVPFMIVFGVLGFVQRKDQPVEVYLAALLRFYLKPHRRVWNQEGYEQHVIITAPKKVEEKRYKDISVTEVRSRLDTLANMMDSRGWAAKGLTTTPSDRLVKVVSPKTEMETAINTDIMDEQTKVSQKFGELLEQNANESRLAAIERMHKIQQSADKQLSGAAGGEAHFNPYPASIHQKVISPTGNAAASQNQPQSTAQPAEPTVPKRISPDIIRLANNKDLTVSAIAREAHSLPTEEVVVSLH